MTKQEKIALELTKAIIIAKPDVIAGENLNLAEVHGLIARSTEMLCIVNDIVADKFKDS